MSSEVIVSLKNINKTYRVRSKRSLTVREYFTNVFRSNEKSTIKALQDINIDIKKGETFGIIGRNGSGKTTLLNVIMGSIQADPKGKVETKGKLMRLSLGLGVDLNLSARDNIYVNGSVIGLSFRKIGLIFDDIIEFADLHEFVDTPVKFYSKGMRQRLLFSIAMHAEADIFLLDEFFGGTGDQDFRDKSESAFHDQILKGRTIIIVSHSMKIIKKFCHRSIWLHKGKIKFSGKTEDVIDSYLEWNKKVKKRRQLAKK